MALLTTQHWKCPKNVGLRFLILLIAVNRVHSEQISDLDSSEDIPSIICPVPVVTVYENINIDTTFLNCTTSDSDVDVTITSTPQNIKIIHDNEDSTTWDLQFSTQPDYESVTQYMVMLTPSYSGSTFGLPVYVNVVILDVDDNAPSFSETMNTITITEDTKMEGSVLNLTVYDLDGSNAYNAKSIIVEFTNDQGDFGSTFTLATTNVQANEVTVQLFVTKELDYEATISYNLMITAVDNAGAGLTGRASVIVNVKDVEDTAPYFTTVQPYTEISEATPEETTLFQVKAIDGDRQCNHPVTYSIVNDGTSEYAFAVDRDTGTVTLLKTLDRDSGTSLYTFMILANETDLEDACSRPNAPSEAETTCTVSLTDVDDCAPQFSSPVYISSIPENSPVGFAVQFTDGNQMIVTDADLGENSRFDISMIDDPDEIFTVTPTTGLGQQMLSIVVKDSSKLDYEQIHGVNLTVLATDRLVPNLTNTAIVVVNIEDQNDQSPQFINITCIGVPENVTSDTEICWTEAIDGDSYPFNVIRYSGNFGSLSNKLVIDPVTGVIKVTSDNVFDYETIQEYYLTISARDNGGTGLMTSNTTVLEITDVNDNKPLFIQTSPQTLLNENEVNFYLPLIVQAMDKDSGVNGIIDFDLTQGQDTFYILSNGTDGELYTATIFPLTPLDFETYGTCEKPDNGCPIPITVMASDEGDPMLSSSSSVTVLLMDENDNIPLFDEHWYQGTNIPETATSGDVAIVHATDKDVTSRYNTVYYRLDNSGLANFQVDISTGQISVSPYANLDLSLPSNKAIYNLTVTADDGGLHEGVPNDQCIVTVNIIDVDNKPPQFTNTPYSTNILENDTYQGTSVFQVSAMDVDADAFLLFSIDFLASVAYDENGMPLTAEDLTPHFNISETSGEVTINEVLDREVMKTVSLSIVATDLNTVLNENSTSANIVFTIEDIDDNPPVFSKSEYDGSVKENDENALITLADPIVATDIDKTFNVITYSVNSTIPEGMDIEIDAKYGTLKVGNIPLDYEATPTVTAILQVTDNGNPPETGSAIVYVSVINVNECAPKFDSTSYVFYIYENDHYFTEPAQVNATDCDAGDYGVVRYRVTDPGTGDYEDRFEIDVDGNIDVLSPLDYETKDQQMVSFTALAYDNPYESSHLSSVALVTVNVLPINDCAPQINNLPVVPGDYPHISELAEINALVFTVKATDNDANKPDNVLQYWILDETEGLFQIDNTTGIVTVKSDLTNKVDLYSLNITVCDEGVIPHSLCTSGVLHIYVDDVNNNDPVIISPVNGSAVHQTEDASGTESHEVLFTLTFTDADTEPEFQKSTYFLTAVKCVEGNGAGTDETYWSIFTIDTSGWTGTLKLNGMIDRENCSKHQFDVTVKNDEDPTRKGGITLYLIVDDIDDWPPEFPEPRQFMVEFTEDVDPSEQTPVPLPTPYDEDYLEGDVYQPIYCVIQDKTSPFKIVDNCSLTIAQTLDFEKQSQYFVQVVATEAILNGTTPNPMSILQVTVNVIDINDNPPYFTNQPFNGGVSSGTALHSVVLTLTADDPDYVADKNQLTYVSKDVQIIDKGGMSGVPNDTLLVNEETGEVTLNYVFVDSMKGYVEFTAVVYDSNRTHHANAGVKVYVLSQSQKLVCFVTHSVEEFQKLSKQFATDFTNVTNTTVVVDEITMHVEDDGATLPSSSDVYINMVDSENNVYSAKSAYDIVDNHLDTLYATVFPKYGIYEIQTAIPLKEKSGINMTLFGLGIAIAFLAVLCFIILGVAIYQHSRLTRKLKAATVTSFGSHPSNSDRLEVPNSNQHAVEGSNPIWNKKIEDDDVQSLASDGISEYSGNSLQHFAHENFQGGVNNPTFTQRIDKLFQDAGLEETSGKVDELNTQELYRSLEDDQTQA